MGAREAGAIFIRLQLATAELQAGVRTLEKQFNKIGASAQRMGAQMSLAFTAPLALIGRAAVSSFSEFDKAMTNAMSVMDKQGQSMRAEFEQTINTLSTKLPISAQEGAKGLFFLASAGFDAEQSMKALPVVAEFATAGMFSMEKAGQLLTQALSGLGLKTADATENAKQLTRISDVLSKANIVSQGTVEDFAEALGSKLAGAMRVTGVSLEDGVAALALYAQQGIKGVTAGQQLQITLRDLKTKAVKNAEAFHQMGIEIYDGNGAFRGLTEVIGDLDKKFAGMSVQQRQTTFLQLGLTQKSSGATESLLLMGDALKRLRGEMDSAAGTTHDIVQVQLTSFWSQMQLIKNQLDIVGRQIGADLAPAMISLGKAVVSAVEGFKNLSPWMRNVLEASAALLAILGPLSFILVSIGGSMLSLSKFVLGAVAGLADLADTALIATAIITGLETTFGALVLLLSGGAFIAAGVALYAYWDDIKKAASDALDYLATQFPETTKLIQASWILIRDAASAAWASIKDYASTAWDGIKLATSDGLSALTAVWKTVSDTSAVAWEGIKLAIKDLIAWIESAAPEIAAAFKKVWTDIADQARMGWAGIKLAIKDAIGFAQDTGNKISVGADLIIAADAAKKTSAATAEAAKNYSELAAKAADAKDGISALAGLANKEAAANYELSASINQASKDYDLNIQRTKEFNLMHQATADAVGKSKTKIDEAAKAIESLTEKLDKARSKSDAADISSQIKDAINSGDNAGFEALKDKFRAAVEAGVLAGLKSDVAKAGNTEAARKMAEETASLTADKELGKLYDEKAKADAKLSQERIKQYASEAREWASVFRDAMTAQKQNFAAMFKDIAASFVGTIVAGLSGVEPGKMSASGIGNWLGGLVNQAVDHFTTSTPNPQGFYSPGGDPSGSGAGQTSVNTTAIKNGIADGIIIATQTIGAAKGAHKIDQQTQSNQGTGGAIGTGVGGTIGAFVGGPAGAAMGAQIGNMFGSAIGKLFKWGAQNPETKARHAFANFIEDGFKKLSTVAFFDAKGQLKTMSSKGLNFLEGPTNKFNDPGWADKINSLGSAARNTFLGLGEAMKDVLKLTDGVGSQIGAMLAENLGGNIDNARLLVQQLGLSLDDMVTALVNVGLTGKETWLEVETQIQGVTQAFQPGLVALGDIKGAYDELSGSAGRGVAALKAIKDVAQEGIDLGAKSLEDLKNQALKQGVDPKFIDDYIKALRDHGITKLEDLAKASNQTLGSIAAQINATNKPLADTWAKMGQDIDSITQKIKDLPTEIMSNITLNVDANISDAAQKVLDSPVGSQIDLPASTVPHAKGGLINRQISFGMGNGQIGTAGEVGPEFIMPARRLPDGSLGIKAIGGNGQGGNQINITVNAPNAAPGMERKIVEAIRQAQTSIIAQTVDVVERRASRGGR